MYSIGGNTKFSTAGVNVSHVMEKKSKKYAETLKNAFFARDIENGYPDRGTVPQASDMKNHNSKDP